MTCHHTLGPEDVTAFGTDIHVGTKCSEFSTLDAECVPADEFSYPIRSVADGGEINSKKSGLF